MYPISPRFLVCLFDVFEAKIRLQTKNQKYLNLKKLSGITFSNKVTSLQWNNSVQTNPVLVFTCLLDQVESPLCKGEYGKLILGWALLLVKPFIWMIHSSLFEVETVNMSLWLSLVRKQPLRRLLTDSRSLWQAEWWLPRDAPVLITRTYEHGRMARENWGCMWNWVANQLTLRTGDYPGSFEWAQCHQEDPLKLELRGKEQCQSDAIWEGLVQPLLSLKVGGDTSQGVQAACGGWQW